MLNITSSMAVAFRQLASESFRPKGTLIYFGVADEEAGGHWGAEYMIDDHWDAVGADYVLTESGGWSTIDHDGTRHVTVNIAEKGIAWRRLRVRGTPGHGSMPFGADNALDHRRRGRAPAGDVPHRAPTSTTSGRRGWRRWICPTTCARRWPIRRGSTTPSPRCRRTTPALAHACTHTTISPNVIHGGQKTNTIPDIIDIDVDMRTVPGDTREVVDGYLAEALGELAERVEVSPLQECDATRSPTDNPLWDALRTRTQVAYPGAELAPGIITGGTDARFYRNKGSIAYGAGLFSPEVTMESFGQRFHGNDERIDVESLGLSDRLLVRRRQARGRLTRVRGQRST